MSSEMVAQVTMFEAGQTADPVGEVVRKHYGTLWRAVRRMGIADADTDDTLQEVFLVYARKFDQVVPGAEASFLFAVAFRIVLQTRRTFARRREDSEDKLAELRDGSASPEESVGHKEALATVDRVLSKLPMELRAVFVLCEIEQVTARAAAEILELPQGTVTSRLARAREMFDRLVRSDRKTEEER